MNKNPSAVESTEESTLEDSHQATKILLRNSTAYLVADMAVKVLSFIFNIYVVRQLGDSRFGLYSTVLAFVGIFSIIGDLGMTQYTTREIARGRRKADDLFWDLVSIRLILAVISTAFIVIAAKFIVGYSTPMVWGVFIACIGFFFHAFFGPINIVLAGRERIDYTSILRIIVQFGFIAFGAWILLGGYSFQGLIVASYIGIPIAAIIGGVYIKRLGLASLRLEIRPRTWLALLKYSLPFALITFTLVAAKDLDTVLLSIMRSPEEVGWYKAAYNLIFKLLFIRGALLSTLSPQMSRYYGVSKNRVGKTFNASFKILWAFSFPVAIGATILAQPIILLLYTDEYAPSAIVLAILIWALPFLNLSSLCGSVTSATDKEKKAAKVYTMVAVLNLITNLIAIPIWGYIGAAASTVLTEIVALALFYRLLHHEFPLTDVKNTLVKPFAAGVIMGGVLLILPGWHLIIVVGIGALTYIATLLLLKPFTETETKIMRSFWLSARRRFSRN